MLVAVVLTWIPGVRGCSLGSARHQVGDVDQGPDEMLSGVFNLSFCTCSGYRGLKKSRREGCAHVYIEGGRENCYQWKTLSFTCSCS